MLFFGFDLGPLTPKMYSPNICTKSSISRLVWQIDRRCLGLPGGFREWPIQGTMQNVVGPTLVAMATTIGLGAEIQTPTGLSSIQSLCGQLLWAIISTCVAWWCSGQSSTLGRYALNVRYINPRFTYLLTYLLTLTGNDSGHVVHARASVTKQYDLVPPRIIYNIGCATEFKLAPCGPNQRMQFIAAVIAKRY